MLNRKWAYALVLLLMGGLSSTASSSSESTQSVCSKVRWISEIAIEDRINGVPAAQVRAALVESLDLAVPENLLLYMAAMQAWEEDLRGASVHQRVPIVARYRNRQVERCERAHESPELMREWRDEAHEFVAEDLGRLR